MSYGRGPPKTDGMTSLKVDNLTYRTRPEDLRKSFEEFGDVGDVYIPRDRFTKESRGFAFVRFYDKRDAEDAMDTMDGKMVDGRELRVQMARYGRPTNSRGHDNRRNDSRRNNSGSGRDRRNRSRSRSRDRYSRSSRRRRSHSRSRSRSQSRSKSRSRSLSRSRSRSQSEPRQSKSRSPSKSPRMDGSPGADGD